MSKNTREPRGSSAIIASNENQSSEQREQADKNRAAIELLRSWRSGDEQEQRQTLEYLQKALDDDRLSDRKLFS